MIWIVRRALAKVRVDVASARSHRTFGNTSGGHSAKDAGHLQLVSPGSVGRASLRLVPASA